MALQYDLYIKSDIDLINIVENIVLNDNILINKKQSENLVEIDLYETLGFLISFYQKIDQYFDYIITDNLVADYEWKGKTTCLSFSINKFFDNTIAKQKMIDIVACVLKDTSEDSILLFNSDTLILEKNNNVISLNYKIEFWELDNMRDRIGLFNNPRNI